MRLHESRPARLLVALLALLAGCEGGTEPRLVIPRAQSIAVSLGTPSVNVVQGANTTVAVTVARNEGYSAPIALSVEGAPSGVTATFSPATLPAGNTATNLTLAVGASATPGSYSLTIRGHGTGVSDQTASLALSVTPAAGFTMAVSPTSVSVTQGAAVTANVTLTRVGGFADPVALSVSGAPAGVTAVVAPANATGTAASVSVNATTDAVPGTYTLTLRGSATGAGERTATIGVEVVRATQAMTQVVLKFCTEVPIWFASQSDGGAWAQSLPSGGSTTYAFSVGTRGGFATVVPVDGGYETRITYGTASELVALGQSMVTGCASPPIGFTRLSGSIAGVSDGQTASIFMGAVSVTLRDVSIPNFSFDNAPDVASDVAAVRQTPGTTNLITDRMILRRGLNIPSGSTIPALDFSATEAFSLVGATASIVGAASDAVTMQTTFTTRTNTTTLLNSSVGATSQTITGVPVSEMAPGDIHKIFAVAVAGGSAFRGAVSFFRVVSDRTLTFGPALSSPSISTVSATTPQRMRAQLGVQTEYAKSVTADFWQDDETGTQYRDVVVNMTAAYAGGAPSTWDVAIPDLGTAGYDTSWGLRAGSPSFWSLMATDAPSLAPVLGGSAPDGTAYTFAVRSVDNGSLTAPRLRRATLRSRLR